jgi:hypothetical protein
MLCSHTTYYDANILKGSGQLHLRKATRDYRIQYHMSGQQYLEGGGKNVWELYGGLRVSLQLEA